MSLGVGRVRVEKAEIDSVMIGKTSHQNPRCARVHSCALQLDNSVMIGLALGQIGY